MTNGVLTHAERAVLSVVNQRSSSIVGNNCHQEKFNTRVVASLAIRGLVRRLDKVDILTMTELGKQVLGAAKYNVLLGVYTYEVL